VGPNGDAELRILRAGDPDIELYCISNEPGTDELCHFDTVSAITRLTILAFANEAFSDATLTCSATKKSRRKSKHQQQQK